MDKMLGNNHRTEKICQKNIYIYSIYIISPAEFILKITMAFLRRDASQSAHHVWWNKTACLNDVCTEIQRLQMILQ